MLFEIVCGKGKKRCAGNCLTCSDAKSPVEISDKKIEDRHRGSRLERIANKLRANMTKTERQFIIDLEIDSGLIEGIDFEVQKPIIEGDCYYIVDLYFKRGNLIVELDGSSHNSAEQKTKDWIRDHNLRKAGYEVLRVDVRGFGSHGNELPAVLDWCVEQKRLERIEKEWE